MREIISSLDLGSSKIKLVVAEILEDRFNVLCALDEDSRGIKKGVIVEPAETEYAIRKLLKRAEEVLGIKVTKTIVNIPEDSADFKIGEATATITSEDKEIQTSDMIRVLQSSIKDKVNKNMEFLTVIPIMFKVDDTKTHMPRGMQGSKLSVKSVVVSVRKEDVYKTVKSLEKCGLEIVDISITSIGCYYAHKNESTDTLCGVVMDVGGDTIKVAVINKGIIINNLVIPYGGRNVDNDLGFIYKLKEDQSKKLKETLALAHKKNASSKEREVLTNTLGDKVTVNQYEVSEIVMSRLHEMLNFAKNEINYLTKKEISYIIITGGLTEMSDFSIEVESVFGKAAYVGKIPIIGVRDNKYAACVGMIKYYDAKLKLRDKEFSIFKQDELDILTGNADTKKTKNDNVFSKVFGIFFDN